MNNVITAIFIIALIFFGVWFKLWQCGELFPNASPAACLFWH